MMTEPAKQSSQGVVGHVENVVGIAVLPNMSAPANAYPDQQAPPMACARTKPLLFTSQGASHNTAGAPAEPAVPVPAVPVPAVPVPATPVPATPVPATPVPEVPPL